MFRAFRLNRSADRLDGHGVRDGADLQMYVADSNVLVRAHDDTGALVSLESALFDFESKQSEQQAVSNIVAPLSVY